MARDGKELLLSRKEERFQTQLVGSTRVVLCSDDVLPIGEGTDIGSHLRDDEHGTSIALYAEEIALSGTVRLGDAIVSAQRLTPIDTNPTCLDLHGDDGAPPNPPAHTDSSEPAIPGGAGAAGSTLRLFLQDVDAAGATPGINVQGGAGANGQQGTDSTSGGDAGAGGAGGHVLALVSHPYLRLLDELRTIYAEADFGSKTSALRAFLDAHEGTPILAPLGDALGGNPTPNSIDAALHAVALVLAGQAEAWGNRFEQALNLRGGSAGLPGQGAPPGNRSTLVPLAGSVQIALTGSGSAMSPVLPPAPFLWVHPAQCAMALEKAKLTYFVADPVTAPDTVKDAVVLFRRLR